MLLLEGLSLITLKMKKNSGILTKSLPLPLHWWPYELWQWYLPAKVEEITGMDRICPAYCPTSCGTRNRSWDRMYRHCLGSFQSKNNALTFVFIPNMNRLGMRLILMFCARWLFQLSLMRIVMRKLWIKYHLYYMVWPHRASIAPGWSVIDSMICSHLEGGGKDTCAGDDSGPLFCGEQGS